MTGFARNYFSSVCCSCPDIDKDGIYIHCRRLRYSLNNDTIKVCLRKENIPTEFKLIKINNYLQKYVNADPHFFFSEEDEEIKATLNLPDWNIFFVEKKLCKTLVHFSFLVIILSVLIIFLSIQLVRIIYYFLGFRKIGYATIWCWFCFFLLMLCFWNSRSVIKVQKKLCNCCFCW